MALDWGKARIGVAASDPDGLLAFPVETVRRGPDAEARLLALVEEYRPMELIIGLPRTLAGQEGLAALDVRDAVSGLAQLVGVPVRMVDERMTTATAARRLAAAGRDSRRQRAVIDQAAAVAILEQALGYERSTGRPPGEELVGPSDRP